VRTKKSVEKGAHAKIFSRPMPEEKGTCGFVQGVPTGGPKSHFSQENPLEGSKFEKLRKDTHHEF
jgi:hypothetical protein